MWRKQSPFQFAQEHLILACPLHQVALIPKRSHDSKPANASTQNKKENKNPQNCDIKPPEPGVKGLKRGGYLLSIVIYMDCSKMKLLFILWESRKPYFPNAQNLRIDVFFSPLRSLMHQPYDIWGLCSTQARLLKIQKAYWFLPSS